MKSKYRELFKAQIGNNKIQIKKNHKEYILMYCKNTVKDFDKKAKRIKDINVESIIKYCKELFDIELSKDKLAKTRLA